MRDNVQMSKDLDARLREADSSDAASTLVELGCDLSGAGRHQDAEVCFRRAVALGEDWVAFNLGNELMAQGRPEEAVHAYQAAVAAGENDGWLNLGQCLEGLGDLAGAMDAYRHADHGGDKNGALALAYMLREQGEYADAERLAQRGASLGNLQAVGAAACWAYDRTRDPALEHDLRRGSEHYPSARADLAEILRETGRIEQAREELTRGAKLGECESWLPLGNLLSDELGDLDAAEDAYRAGIAAGDRNCHNNLGNLLLEREDVAGAEEQFREGGRLGDQLAVRALRNLLDDED
jgi:tetratricopeptide (TPR) repeat protein